MMLMLMLRNSVRERKYTSEIFQQPGLLWIPGVISKATGPVSYQVMLESGQIVRRYQEHVRLWQLVNS